MMFLVLAYGTEEDWNALSQEEQSSLLAQDEVLRGRGSLVAAVEPDVVTVRAWSGTPQTQPEPVGRLPIPLAGFGIIEAEDVQKAVELVADTPCARARGAVELRPILSFNRGAAVVR